MSSDHPKIISLAQEVIALCSSDELTIFRRARSWSKRVCSLLATSTSGAGILKIVQSMLNQGESLMDEIDKSTMNDSIILLLNDQIIDLRSLLIPYFTMDDEQSSVSIDQVIQTEPRSPRSILEAVQLMNVMLPTVPVYSGDVTEFPIFIKLFNTAVHDVPMLPNEIKFQSLSSKLSGQARSVISGCSATGEDYHNCYEALCSENTGKYRVAQRTFSNRSSIPKVKNSNAHDLEKFLFAAENWTRSVNALPTDDQVGFLMFELLFPSLSTELQDKFNREEMEGRDDIPTISDLFSFVKKELKVARMVPSAVPLSHGKSESRQSSSPARKTKNRPISNLRSRSIGTTSSDHLSSSSFTVLHQTVLQDDTPRLQYRSNFKFQTSNGLLPTAVITISPDGKTKYLVRALLDSGSEVNIISFNVATQTKLALRQTTNRITGVGHFNQPVKYIASAFLHTKSGRVLPLTAHVVDRVIDQLPSRSIEENLWFHIDARRNVLADPKYNRRSPVDVLLGVDLFMQLVHGPIIKPIGTSPWLLNSELGWLVLGRAHHKRSTAVRFNDQISVLIFDSDLPVSSHQVKRLNLSSCAFTTSSHGQFRSFHKAVPRSSKPGSPEYLKTVLHQIKRLMRKIFITTTAIPEAMSQVTVPLQLPKPARSDNERRYSHRLQKNDLINGAQSTALPVVRNLFSIVPPQEETFPHKKLFNLFRSLPCCSGSQPSHVQWVIVPNASPEIVSVPTVQDHRTDDLLRKMFEIESVEEVLPWSPAEIEADKMFNEQVQRDENGRYIVPLLFSEDRRSLGVSRHIALRQLYRLETKLSRNPILAKAYTAFMYEYLSLGHMRPVPPPSGDQPNYYIPHHAVHRSDDPPEKIRVVFNASQRTTNGRSLNEILHAGPKLQPDIVDMITRFRSYKYVFIADIRQMFRQINHFVQDHDMLRIVWRASPQDPIKDFALQTVTYGTTCAPFLANKVIKHLAQEGAQEFPSASEVLNFHTYVDDVHGGGERRTEAVIVRDQLIELLATAGFELRKWASNSSSVLRGIPVENRLDVAQSVNFNNDDQKPLKMLGIAWNPQTDSFFFKVPATPVVKTKRELASQVGRIYDPLGWVMPVSVHARGIQRQVCQSKYEWDDILPPYLVHEWSQIAESMGSLTELAIPRHINVTCSEQWLIGFADASEKAYAAVIYHVSQVQDHCTVRLVISRARIAPLKSESIPRLELLAGELLSKMYTKLRPQFSQVPDNHIVACSDSTIVLSWLTADPSPVWKVFVGNRVSKTLKGIPSAHWFHVPTKDNPADIASRGALPKQLVENQFWWQGPAWLQLPRSEWPIKRIRPDLSCPTVHEEIRSSKASYALTSSTFEFEERYSSYPRLRRITAWILRFIQNCRQPHSRTRQLTTEELRLADRVLILRAQKRHFQDIYGALINDRPFTKLMKQLALFKSNDGIIRVGGRLELSSLRYETKHPALLPQHDILTKLLIRHAHESCLHIGPRATLAHLRTKYWIVNGRNLLTKVLSGCNRCFSIKPRPFQPPMGQLPAGRVEISYPFEQVGIDFAGPFTVSVSGLRGTKAIEIYLAVFVCFSTKAVHLEVVMDLTTDAFLQSLERFMGRRGVPSVVWSDNGRNFVGAANLLRKLRLALEQGIGDVLSDRLSMRGIEWRFIPPKAPHFGGLWESAVKSAKRLLRVHFRNQTPTLQAFTTVTTRIEAILNSRPLVHQSGSPDDIEVLTPGHFLIQRPLTALPESSVTNTSPRFVPKWNFVNQLVNQFWQKWQKEYLLDLQSKLKWNTPTKPAQVGDVVLIIEDNTPPLQWPMGVITQIRPGKDGVPRVADLRTSTSSLQRPLVRLCPLPKDE